MSDTKTLEATGTAGATEAADDFQFQAAAVADAAWRLLWMQDDNPASPSHGCFHYAYWRDKTSDFADARFQEASATLGLLAHDALAGLRTAGRLPDPERLLAAFEAGLGFWSRMQYRDGAFDEWYRGERGYAAAAFTSIAFGLAHRFLGDRLPPAARGRLAETIARSGDWLSRRWDRVKANHEAAGAAALALAWEVTGEARLRAAAEAKLADTLARVRPEGWYPEVGGMDLGYCSVLLDYVMLTAEITGDMAPVPAMRRLFAFMLPHLHPDGTILAESGLCLNPYVSRLGTGLLSRHDDAAAALAGLFATSSPGVAGLSPTLGDDLRLARWSHLPLVTALLRPTFRTLGPAALAAAFPPGWTVRRDSALAAWHGERRHVYFAAAGGGHLRVYDGARLVISDRGVHVRLDGAVATTQGYDPDRRLDADAAGVCTTIPLAQPRFFFPSFLSRLVLRFACTTALGARLIRAAIDHYRLKARTAINQSAAPLGKAAGGVVLERAVAVAPDGAVAIADTIRAAGRPVEPACVVPLFQVDDGTVVVRSSVTATEGAVRVTRQLAAADAVA